MCVFLVGHGPKRIGQAHNGKAEGVASRNCPAAVGPCTGDMLRLVIGLAIPLVAPVVANLGLGCSELNFCSGHGFCESANAQSANRKCRCLPGWGAPTDPLQPSNDCSQRETVPPRACPPTCMGAWRLQLTDAALRSGGARRVPH